MAQIRATRSAMLAMSPHRLRTSACPRCTYLLDGLPIEGECPECGRAYDDGTVYLFGQTMGGLWGPIWSRRQIATAWAVLALLAGILIAIGTGWPCSLWLCVAYGWQVAWATVRRSTDAGGASVRVRLGPDGVSQGRRGLGPFPFDRADRVAVVPWRRVGLAIVAPGADAGVRLILGPTFRWWERQRRFVSAVAPCPVEQAEWLRLQVDEWRAAAAGGDDR